MSEETRISFKEQTGLRILKDNTDITTGKVIVNDIEITSVEDWEKVTKSLDDLQQRINKVEKYIDRLLKEDEPMYLDAVLITIREILGDKE